MNISYTEFESAKHTTYSQKEIPATKEKQFNAELPEIPLHDPFERIALCLSGGGYRAAAFSLGTMAYLNSISYKGKTLLQRVCLISSTSGGSITSLTYGLHLANKKGDDFESFYKSLSRQLHGEDLIERALTMLNDSKKWKGDKKRTLINAFAQTYDELLFKGAQMGKLRELRPDMRICINATEFYRGLTFRFQNYGFIGNKFINLDKERNDVTDKIKIADVLAASSCFPGGFEPIEFPRDFAHETLPQDTLRKATSVLNYDNVKVNAESIPLMDGGITDNQGINSAMLVDMVTRREKEPPICLFIVTDVASYFMDHYDAPEERKSIIGLLSLSGLYKTSLVVSVIALLAAVYLLEGAASPLKKYAGAFLLFPSASFLGWFVYDLISNFVRFLLKKQTGFGVLKSLFQIKSFSDEILRKLYDYLRKLRISNLEQMIKNRLSSTVTMTSDINLKHVRRLINDLFYSNELFEDRRCTNYIYEYSKHNLVSKTTRLNDRAAWPDGDRKLMLPTDEMSKIAEDARQMGTTLWFDSRDQKAEKLEKLIATGRFTVCGSLLEYIIDLKTNPHSWARVDEGNKREIDRLEVRLREDWKKFKVNPME